MKADVERTASEVALRFELSVTIRRPPSDVFAFLREKDLPPQEPGSPVLALDKTKLEQLEPGTWKVSHNSESQMEAPLAGR